MELIMKSDLNGLFSCLLQGSSGGLKKSCMHACMQQASNDQQASQKKQNRYRGAPKNICCTNTPILAQATLGTGTVDFRKALKSLP